MRIKSGFVASFHPNQIENASKLATVPVFSTPNSQQIGENWRIRLAGEDASVMAQKLKTGVRSQSAADLVKLPEQPLSPSLWPSPTPLA
jgi:hypothetical protein